MKRPVKPVKAVKEMDEINAVEDADDAPFASEPRKRSKGAADLENVKKKAFNLSKNLTSEKTDDNLLTPFKIC